MSFSVYQATVPAFQQILGALSANLTKAAAHAEAKKIDPSVLINARLAPDMLPLDHVARRLAWALLVLCSEDVLA